MNHYVADAISKFLHAEGVRDQGNNNDRSHFLASMAQGAALIAIAEQLTRIADAVEIKPPAIKVGGPAYQQAGE